MSRRKQHRLSDLVTRNTSKGAVETVQLIFVGLSRAMEQPHETKPGAVQLEPLLNPSWARN